MFRNPIGLPFRNPTGLPYKHTSAVFHRSSVCTAFSRTQGTLAMPKYGQTRSPFHVQFYLVGILFLIFDLEILLIYPLAVTLYQISTYGFWVFIVFLLVLTVGFVLEIGSGVLYFTDQKSTVTTLRPSIDN